jgi:hypothetical protein
VVIDVAELKSIVGHRNPIGVWLRLVLFSNLLDEKDRKKKKDTGIRSAEECLTNFAPSFLLDNTIHTDAEHPAGRNI